MVLTVCCVQLEEEEARRQEEEEARLRAEEEERLATLAKIRELVSQSVPNFTFTSLFFILF